MTSAIVAMPPILRRASLRVVMFLLLGLMVAFAIALFQAVGSERAARWRASQTSEIILQVQEVLAIGVEAESGQRGYLMTGDASYLVPLTAAEERWLSDLAALRARFVGDAPEQVEIVDAMIDMAARKLDEMTQTVAFYDAGNRDAALALVRSDVGKELLDDFSDLATRLSAEESRLLARQINLTEAIERRTLWILAVLGIAAAALFGVSLWLERRISRAERSAQEADALRLAYEKTDLLAREMDHRTKNLFTVIGAMISLTGRSETDLRLAMEKLRGRVNALALAHGVAQGRAERRFATMGDVVEATLGPYDAPDLEVVVEGPMVDLPIGIVSPLGLILHELATNSVKYGALSSAGGKVVVTWSRAAEGPVTLRWSESGTMVSDDAAPRGATGGEGFGSIMMRQAALQLDGSVERVFGPDGLVVTLVFTP